MPFIKGNIPWNKGKKLTEEYKLKISKSKKGKTNGHFGLYHTEETKRKMSESHMEHKHTEDQKRKIGLASIGNKSHRGRIQSNESNLKRSKTLKGKYIGKLASGWRNGKSFELYGIEFNKELKEKVRKRDNYTCQECDKTEKELKKKLCVHHIDYNKKNNKENNLISLCKKCHSKTNFKREDWTNYFENR